ncbi:MAG: VWA domain-containing protein [Myxococcales bacterium]|nr:VWA domain-containing protein [Myxococcales bacterium]
MLRKVLLSAFAVSLLGLLGACVSRPLDEAPPKQSVELPRFFPQSVEKDVDLLFVIDNSGSMGEEQQNLVQNFPRLIEALRADSLGADGTGKPCNEGTREGCRIPNVHIGVVSSDLGAGTYGLPSCERQGGDAGRLQKDARVAGCQPPADAYISYIDGQTNIPNAGSDTVQAVKDAFTCIARLGTDGCGFEAQLESARRALQPNANPGFLRDNAFLAIVFITDEDDCSAQKQNLFDPSQQALSDPLGPLTSFRCFEFGVQCDINDRNQIGPRQGCVPAQDWLYNVQTYVQFFKSLKNPGRVVVAAIAGPTDRVEIGKDGNNPVLKASCTSAAGNAVPGIRIRAVVDEFQTDGQYTSICEANFGPALEAIGKKILGKLGGQCLPRPVLTPNGGVACQQGDRFGAGNGGVCATSCLDKVSCNVTEIVGQGTNNSQTTKIEKCPTNLWYPTDWRKERDCGAACPCWRIVKKDTKDCDPTASGSPYALDVLRNGEAPKGSVAEVRCLSSANKWGSQALGDTPQCI